MRYFVGFIIVIVLIIMLIVLLFHGGGKKPVVPTTTKTLISYVNTDAEVRFTTDGPVNAEQNHRQEQITVSRDNVNYEQIDGYATTVKRQENFANNVQNFDVFLHSLEKAGYTLGDTSKALANEKGYCATGERYVFEIVQDGNIIQRFWNTSCNHTHTYNGDLDLTITLFQAQVPGLTTLQEGFSLDGTD